MQLFLLQGRTGRLEEVQDQSLSYNSVSVLWTAHGLPTDGRIAEMDVSRTVIALINGGAHVGATSAGFIAVDHRACKMLAALKERVARYKGGEAFFWKPVST